MALACIYFHFVLAVSPGFCWGNLRERDHLGDPGVDGKVISRRILRKWDVGVWNGSIWLRIGTGGSHNEPSGPIKRRGFLH